MLFTFLAGKAKKGRKKGSAGPPAKKGKTDKKARKSPEPVHKSPDVKTGDITDSDNEMNVTDIIPVKKEIIIGNNIQISTENNFIQASV